jgi:hypothetical protein
VIKYDLAIWFDCAGVSSRRRRRGVCHAFESIYSFILLLFNVSHSSHNTSLHLHIYISQINVYDFHILGIQIFFGTRNSTP